MSWRLYSLIHGIGRYVYVNIAPYIELTVESINNLIRSLSTEMITLLRVVIINSHKIRTRYRVI